MTDPEPTDQKPTDQKPTDPKPTDPEFMDPAAARLAISKRIAAGVAIDVAELPAEVLAQPAIQRLLQLGRVMQQLGKNQEADLSATQIQANFVDDNHAEGNFGAYRLLRLLGTGGMGKVWLAQRIDGLVEHQVAIKRVHGQTMRLMDRLLSERKLLARLSHPGIARFIDAGVDAENAPWLAMEYVDGVPITQWCSEQKLGLRERLELFRKVCAAVEHAHRHLIVHRDIKPNNVLVDREGQPKLLDFGIAKLLDGESGEFTVNAMTPAYAAPEQLRAEAVSTATDVYALGLLLFRLLTGALPTTRSVENIPAILQRLHLEESERPSARVKETAERRPVGTQLVHGADGARVEIQSETNLLPSTTLPFPSAALKGDLDAIVAQALRLEPEDRYGSVVEFSADIERYLSAKAVRARAPTRWYLYSRFVQRNWLAFALSSGIVCALIVGAGAALWQWEQARDQAARAEREVVRVARAQEFLVSIFASADPGQARGERLTAKEILDTGAARLATEFNADPAQQAELALKLANIYLNLQAPAQAEKLTLMASAALARMPSAENALLGETEIMFGKAHLLQSQFSQARIRLQAGIARLRIVPSRQLLVADALMDLGASTAQLGDANTAIAQQREGLALFARYADIKSPQYALAQVKHGLLLEGTGHFAPARAAYEAGLDVLSNTYGELHPSTANARYALAGVLDRLGERKLAEQAFALSIPALRKLYDNRGSDLANALFSYGIFLNAGARYGDAEALYREALTMVQPDRILYAHLHRYLGKTLLLRQQFPAAIAAFEIAIKAYLGGDGNTASQLWRTKADLGTALAQTGHVQAALSMQTEAVAQLSVILGPDAYELIQPLRGLAQTQTIMANTAGAAQSLEHALRIAIAQLGATHLTTCGIYQSLASVLAPEKADTKARFTGPLIACVQSIALADPQHPLLDEIRVLLTTLER